ncbi:hypothetical protein [Brachyspira hampsonii]|uniref:Uncharacterized protein n=1 Tax=Brachyspira hampsonii 30446 TaxID=1289135 RepID=A0A2U4F9M8_9SPIR|nr:hypothetical protein [Brachyspira hampsonii]EKV58130.1 hypothetical protein A966_01236 [Brachyspira hampsonii 30446]MBW5390544.1 hypothetical protein [Brachyspira hampsonii]MBW5393676.1 hypothetical protein [Brachyspira hampsonii]OEJ17098.1 hypothetical protein A9495_07900 [Brachyspira hampsonii]
MFIMVLINVLKSKYFYITLILIALLAYVSSLNIKLNIKNKEIDKLNNEIYKLEYSNKLLSKDNDFKKKQIDIVKTFSNSDEYIDVIEDIKLSDDSIKAFNSIVSNYYRSF